MYAICVHHAACCSREPAHRWLHWLDARRGYVQAASPYLSGVPVPAAGLIPMPSASMPATAPSSTPANPPMGSALVPLGSMLPGAPQSSASSMQAVEPSIALATPPNGPSLVPASTMSLAPVPQTQQPAASGPISPFGPSPFGPQSTSSLGPSPALGPPPQPGPQQPISPSVPSRRHHTHAPAPQPQGPQPSFVPSGIPLPVSLAPVPSSNLSSSQNTIATVPGNEQQPSPPQTPLPPVSATSGDTVGGLAMPPNAHQPSTMAPQAAAPAVASLTRLGVPVVTLLLAGLSDDILTNATAQAVVLEQLRANVQAAVGNIAFNITLQRYSGSAQDAGYTRRKLSQHPDAGHYSAGGSQRAIASQTGSTRMLQQTTDAALVPAMPNSAADLAISNVMVSDASSSAATGASSGSGPQLIAVITFPASTAANQQSFVSAQQLADNIQANPALVLTGPLLASAQVQVVVLRLDPSSLAAPDGSEAPSAGAVQRAATPAGTPPPPCDPTCTRTSSPSSGRRLQQWMPASFQSRRLQTLICCSVSPHACSP